MKSPVNHNYEGEDFNFNPFIDFSQFLEEAKKHKTEEHFNLAPREKQLGEDDIKKKKRSWKRSLVSFWKLAERKKNLKAASLSSSVPSKASRGGRVSASGPLYESGSEANIRPHGPRSGPLTGFFLPKKRVENEMPYMSLDKLDIPDVVQSYGPVYLVT